ncbi:unnamed protein product [Clonostachys rosea]|uniref:Uncharacterized protein n=1 Tax=Bionectria ochroleuca TaxID=29856 RepID=A0ABY6TZZ2_BIOOC|nr:unnamed protein product [Clonostachys rosea]
MVRKPASGFNRSPRARGGTEQSWCMARNITPVLRFSKLQCDHRLANTLSYFEFGHLRFSNITQLSAMASLRGKIIAITGSASGIGLATTRRLAALGATISMVDVNTDVLANLHRELTAKYPGQKFLSKTVSVSDRSAVTSWIKETVHELGPLHGAANLAGIMGKDAYKVATEHIDDTDWERVMGVNLYGVLNCMREEIKNIRDGGSIVNASSLAGLIGVPRHAAYVCSKHAVIGLSRTAAKELGPRGVRVNAVAPGPIATPLMADAVARMGSGVTENTLALGRAGEPEEVASVVSFLLSDESTFVTGSVQVIDGGIAC